MVIRNHAWCKQTALSRCGMSQVVHRDIKPGNLLIAEDSRLLQASLQILSVVRKCRAAAVHALSSDQHESRCHGNAGAFRFGRLVTLEVPCCFQGLGWVLSPERMFSVGSIFRQLAATGRPFPNPHAKVVAPVTSPCLCMAACARTSKHHIFRF